jgi:hypothetical protein
LPADHDSPPDTGKDFLIKADRSSASASAPNAKKLAHSASAESSHYTFSALSAPAETGWYIRHWSKVGHIYAFWSSSQFPEVEPAVKKYLSVPPSSGASKQLFSSAGQLFADQRNSLLG